MKVDLHIPVSEQENQRQAYRASVADQVKLVIAGCAYRVLDISSTGISFETKTKPQSFIEDASVTFSLTRPYRLQAKLKVMFYRDGRCGSEFVGLSSKAHKLISELVVEIQKNAIRQRQKELKAEQEAKRQKQLERS